MIPFIVADLGNILGGFCSQVVIRRAIVLFPMGPLTRAEALPAYRLPGS